LRENPFSNWALRIGKYRVFYHVMEDIMTISIVAVGFKEHNNLYIRGKKVKI
jgi:mRNA-degrading endonuclease RelE of RelBE toxin-antitoxin system